MYNQHCKLNFSWIHILSDIKRTGLNYDCEKKTMYEGLSQKGCIMGVKVRNQDVEELEYELNQLENPLDANKDVNNIVKEELDYKALFEKLQQENDELQNKNKKLKRKLKKLSEKEEEEKKEEANTKVDYRNAIFGFDKKQDESTHNPFN